MAQLLSPDIDAVSPTDYILSISEEPSASKGILIYLCVLTVSDGPVHLFRKFFQHFRTPGVLQRIENAVASLACSIANYEFISQEIVSMEKEQEIIETSSLQLLSACLYGLSGCSRLNMRSLVA